MVQAVRGLVAAALLCAAATQGQAAGPDDRYRIELTINGSRVEGTQERAARLAAAGTQGQKEAILDEPLPEIAQHASFQLVVSVTGPDGTVSDLTGSRRLTYESWGCLTTSASGFVSVVPSGPCEGARLPRLWVVLHDQSGSPIALNEYLFRMTPP